MTSSSNQPQGPDLRGGIPATQLPEGGLVLGHVEENSVLLVRLRGEVHGLGATCTHWGGPLADGLVVDGTVRCPWHHACFSVETGNVLGGPAIDPVDRWGVEEFDGVVRATQRLEPTRSGRTLGPGAEMPESVVIVGAGAAGTVAAAELRALGFDRELIVIDPDPDASVDRPNLSKDYLAGKASEEWIPLRSSDWWKEREIRRHRAAVDDHRDAEWR